MDSFSMPPIDVIIGLVLIFVVGLILGAAICLPIAHKNSDLPLEKLSGDWIWRYTPDWILSIIGCVVSIAVCFILISGIWRM
ncbi:MAG: hypothetical protein IK062_11395 [Selenomonadaceae bacterium]|nr:hypothetical protein [Selenomonadaceae bacterium]